MQTLLVGRHGRRLQLMLIIGFALTTAITITVGALLTYGLINNYLEDAQDERVGRDMDLANAFYNSQRDDISSTAGRIASESTIQRNLPTAAQGDGQAIEIIEEAIDNEIANLPSDAQRFVVVTDAQGNAYTFPNLFLGTGGSVRVHTGSGSNSATDLYWGLDAPVWGEPGDIATLRDESGLPIDTFELP